MHITFVVKMREQAYPYRYTDERDIRAVIINRAGKDFVVFRCEHTELEKLAHWFCEQSDIVPGVGYPDGTLLIYSFHENERE